MSDKKYTDWAEFLVEEKPVGGDRYWVMSAGGKFEKVVFPTVGEGWNTTKVTESLIKYSPGIGLYLDRNEKGHTPSAISFQMEVSDVSDVSENCKHIKFDEVQGFSTIYRTCRDCGRSLDEDIR